ncbi:MAG: 50S ribosomal protein L11 methyltransferase [Desulfamplus sp.]|nr:50S ribosomal protein L11 methyltransferase [Desulfamplus sp.]
MSNPYENLWIYYLEGIPERGLQRKSNQSFIGNWQEEGFSFLFFSAPADELVERMVQEDSGICLVDRYEMTGEQWHGETIESYTTGSLCISPPWKIPFVNRPDIRHVLLDPGVVFGTGRHQTTEDCLGYIEYLCKYRNLSIGNVLDLGTGTGLLALGAAVLGCKAVLALDFNLLAVRTARRNVEMNGLCERIIVIQGKAEEFISVPADLVVANIHYDVMKRIIDNPGFGDHKWFILSGLLKSEAEKVKVMLCDKGIHIVEAVSRDGIWNTILASGAIYSCNNNQG